ncbi:unnamed protein product [Amoebophrya sp. A25]|nr:unnamed protein product [Amoebophrya sp. A25]|eukprot:GSA25T00005153001.1
MKSIQYVHFPEIDSTHTWVERNHGSLDPEKLTCISADYQMAGRGTGQRVWHAPRGKNLLCTFYFMLPESRKAQAPSFLQVAALAAMHAMKRKVCVGLQMDKLHFALKWPNDVMLNERKMGGILSRMVVDPVRHTTRTELLLSGTVGSQAGIGGATPSGAGLTLTGTSAAASSSGLGFMYSGSSPVAGSGVGEISPVPTMASVSFVGGARTGGAPGIVRLGETTPAGQSSGGGETVSKPVPPELCGLFAGAGRSGTSSDQPRPAAPVVYEESVLSSGSPGSIGAAQSAQGASNPAGIENVLVTSDEKQIGMIVSFGLNINLSSEDLAEMVALYGSDGETSADVTEQRSDGESKKTEPFAWAPTSLLREVGNPILSFDVGRIRQELAHELVYAVRTFAKSGYGVFAPLLPSVMLYQDQHVVFAPRGRHHADRTAGIFRGLDEEGWFVLELPIGATEKYCCGELCPPEKFAKS